jgi:hypothetical protein
MVLSQVRAHDPEVDVNVYRIRCSTSPEYASYVVQDESLIGRSVSEDWGRNKPLPSDLAPIHFKRFIGKKRDAKLPIADYPIQWSFPLVQMFSARAVDVLREMLEPNGEFLPLICDDGEFYLYNLLTQFDALDAEHAEVEYFRSSGRLSDIFRYALHADRLRGATVFRLSGTSIDFVTQPFVDRVCEAGLTGFEFVFVWSDEGIPAPRLDRSERVVDANPDVKKPAAHLH